MIKNKRRVIKQTLCAVVMCLVMGTGIISFADDKGTVIPASAKIRAAADASSEQISSVAQGGSLDIIAKTTGTDGNTWYQVYVDANTKGYIRADLVKVAGTGTISTLTSDTTTTTSNTTSTDQTATQTTSVDSKQCTVSQNSVRIRKGASTSYDIVATANKGLVLTITGEATGTDGKVWYQVSFTNSGKEVTGYVRSDLVTFDEVTNDPAVSEITGEAGGDGDEQAQTQETEESQEEESTTSSNSSDGITLMNVDETPYVLPGFTAVSLSWNDESIKAYSNGGFYLFYARMANGDEGWYIFDSEKGDYQRYVYTASASATVPGSSSTVGLIPVIVLIIIIIILAAVIGLLIIKLRSATDDDYEYEDDEDDEVEDLEFEDIQPRRQQRQAPAQSQEQRRQVQGQPRQQGQNANSNGQQVRRPQGQNTNQNGQQVRRPNGQQTQATNQNGQQVRRPNGQQSQTANQNAGQVRRTNGQATNQQGGTQQRRPNRQRPNNTGYENGQSTNSTDDDDINFIDV